MNPNTKLTDGIISSSEQRNIGLTVITVKYTVNDIEYKIEEAVKVKKEAIKIGFIPIGQKTVSKLPSISAGSKVIVEYSPDSPQKAHIVGNEGMVTG